MHEYVKSLPAETKTLILINFQKSFNKKNDSGNEPVHVACMNGNLNAIQVCKWFILQALSIILIIWHIVSLILKLFLTLKALLDFADDIEKQLDSHQNAKRPKTSGVYERVNENGKTVKLAFKQPKILAYLLNRIEDESEVNELVLLVIDSAVSDSTVDALLVLLSRLMDDNRVSHIGRLFHLAIKKGAWECFNLLAVWEGVTKDDVNVKDDQGYTVRHSLVAKECNCGIVISSQCRRNRKMF